MSSLLENTHGDVYLDAFNDGMWEELDHYPFQWIYSPLPALDDDNESAVAQEPQDPPNDLTQLIAQEGVGTVYSFDSPQMQLVQSEDANNIPLANPNNFQFAVGAIPNINVETAPAVYVEDTPVLNPPHPHPPYADQSAGDPNFLPAEVPVGHLPDQPNDAIAMENPNNFHFAVEVIPNVNVDGDAETAPVINEEDTPVLNPSYADQSYGDPNVSIDFLPAEVLIVQLPDQPNDAVDEAFVDIPNQDQDGAVAQAQEQVDLSLRFRDYEHLFELDATGQFYRCPLCNKKVNATKREKRPGENHFNDNHKPTKCNYPGCNRVFAGNVKMKKHAREDHEGQTMSQINSEAGHSRGRGENKYRGNQKRRL